jgi:DNA-binding response OmpR family regulator
VSKLKILIIEDEESIRMGLRDNFEMEDYDVYEAAYGNEGIETAQKVRPDLVLLDLMLPSKSGFEVCRLLRRKFPDIYIIMLTAKTEESSKVAGLEMGADDYVTKPFSILELIARVKSFLRRKKEQTLNTEPLRKEPSTQDVVQIGDTEVDFKKFTATQKGVSLDLSVKEIEILRYMYLRPDEVVKREDLLQEIWGYTFETMPTTRTIDNHMLRLRQKLEKDPTNPRLILSVRGAGYKFKAQVE